MSTHEQYFYDAIADARDSIRDETNEAFGGVEYVLSHMYMPPIHRGRARISRHGAFDAGGIPVVPLEHDEVIHFPGHRYGFHPVQVGNMMLHLTGTGHDRATAQADIYELQDQLPKSDIPLEGRQAAQGEVDAARLTWRFNGQGAQPTESMVHGGPIVPLEVDSSLTPEQRAAGLVSQAGVVARLLDTPIQPIH